MYLSNVMQDVFSIPLSMAPWISCFVSHSNTQVQIYYCEDKEESEQFRMFFDRLTLSSIIMKAPLLCYPDNDAFFSAHLNILLLLLGRV